MVAYTARRNVTGRGFGRFAASRAGFAALLQVDTDRLASRGDGPRRFGIEPVLVVLRCGACDAT